MSNFIVRDTAALFDPATGQWVGVIDGNGQEHLIVPPGAKAVSASTSSSGVVVIPGVPVCVASFSVPFVIPPGDGGATGLTFTGGGGGAFTLSGAIMSGAGAVASSCYMYLPANAGGSGCAEGWYYTEFSSDTAGIVYSNRYTSGAPEAPASKTPFAGSPAGRITTPITELTAPRGFILPANMLGKHGVLRALIKVLSTADTAAKNYRLRGNDVSLGVVSVSTSPNGWFELAAQNLNGVDRQITGRQSTAGTIGSGAATILNELQTLDTSADSEIKITMQVSANTAGAILVAGSVMAYGYA